MGTGLALGRSSRALRVERLPKTLLHTLEAFLIDSYSRFAFGEFYASIYRTRTLEWDKTLYRLTAQQCKGYLVFI